MFCSCITFVAVSYRKVNREKKKKEKKKKKGRRRRRLGRRRWRARRRGKKQEEQEEKEKEEGPVETKRRCFGLFASRPRNMLIYLRD